MVSIRLSFSCADQWFLVIVATDFYCFNIILGHKLSLIVISMCKITLSIQFLSKTYPKKESGKLRPDRLKLAKSVI